MSPYAGQLAVDSMKDLVQQQDSGDLKYLQEQIHDSHDPSVQTSFGWSHAW